MANKPTNLDPIELLSDKERTRAGLRELIRCADVHVAAVENDRAIIEAAYAPLVGKTDLTGDNLVEPRRNISDKLSNPWSNGNYSEAIDCLPRSARDQWYGLYKFLIHDITHIKPSEIHMHGRQISFFNYVGQRARGERDREDQRYDKDVLAPDWQQMYQEVLPLIPDIITQLRYPHLFAKAVAELKLGRKLSDLETIDMQKMLEVIMKSMQLRFSIDDYVVTTPDSRLPARNELIMDLSPSQLETNPGMIWSVLYNLIKNAAKELTTGDRDDDDPNKPAEESTNDLALRLVRGELPEKPIKLHVKLENMDECDATIIHVMDSGEGLRADEIMDSMKAIVSEELLHEADLKSSVKRILSAWEENPFAVRALRMGDVYDLAGLARVSGFVTRERTQSNSSGLGLWGATYLTQKMGGEIIYTNTKDGGALFTVIVPNHYFTNESRSKRQLRGDIRNIRKQLEQGTGFLHTLPRKAA